MSIAIAIAIVLMEEFSVMIGQQLIIQSMIDRIDKVRRHALNHINEPKILLDETWLIPTHELCDVLGVDSLEEILSSKIRGIALALAGKKEYHPRSIAGGAEQLMELLRPAADEEQAEDERKLRNRILGLAARYLSASVEERTKILISLEGSRTRALSDTEEVTELVRLRINADHEYERVSKQLRKLQVKKRITPEPECDPRCLSEQDLTLHTHLYREEVRRLKKQFAREIRNQEQQQEAS